MTMNWKKVFISFNHRLFLAPAIVRAIFIQEFDQSRTFLLNKKILRHTKIVVAGVYNYERIIFFLKVNWDVLYNKVPSLHTFSYLLLLTAL